MDYKCKSLSENIFGSAHLKTGYQAETGTLFPFRLINFSWPIIGNLLWQCLLAQEFQFTLKASIEADSRWKNIAYKAYFIQLYFTSLTWFGVLVIHQFHSHPTDFGRCKDLIMIIMLIQKSVRERRIPSSKELVHLLERIFSKTSVTKAWPIPKNKTRSVEVSTFFMSRFTLYLQHLHKDKKYWSLLLQLEKQTKRTCQRNC